MNRVSRYILALLIALSAPIVFHRDGFMDCVATGLFFGSFAAILCGIASSLERW